MADTTTTGTTTTGKVADYSGEDADSILTVMPSAADYTVAKYGDAKAAKKAWNKEFKAWQDAAFALANPTETVAKKVKGIMTEEQARKAVENKHLRDMTDTQKRQIKRLVADGNGNVTVKAATIAILTYHHNYCLKGWAMMNNLIAEVNILL